MGPPTPFVRGSGYALLALLAIAFLFCGFWSALFLLIAPVSAGLLLCHASRGSRAAGTLGAGFGFGLAVAAGACFLVVLFGKVQNAELLAQTGMALVTMSCFALNGACNVYFGQASVRPSWFASFVEVMLLVVAWLCVAIIVYYPISDFLRALSD